MDKLTSIHEYSDYLHSQTLMSMSDRWKLLRKRVDFGRRKIKLWMFFPCKTKNNVFFEGFQYKSQGYVTNGVLDFDEESIEKLTIEHLVKYNLELTTAAKKQLGL